MSLAKKLMVIGKVVKKLAPKISLVEVQTNQLDPYLRMYFGRYDEYKADDGSHYTKVDDYVLIKGKADPERVDLVYEVAEIVIREGQLKDPLTGKRILGDNHRVDFAEDMERMNGLLPDRGRCQETLTYADSDLTEGMRQSPKDKS